jgi:hypothetical protein
MQYLIGLGLVALLAFFVVKAKPRRPGTFKDLITKVREL